MSSSHSCRVRNAGGCRRRRIPTLYLFYNISCKSHVISIFAFAEVGAVGAQQQQHQQQPNPSKKQQLNNNGFQGRRTQRRRQKKVASLNAYLQVKDEFDKYRKPIENFVFQSLNSFSTPIAEDDDPSTTSQSNNNLHTKPSREYTYNAFFESLRSMSVEGILGQTFHVETNPFIDVDSAFSNTFVTSTGGANNSPSNEYIHDENNMAFYLGQDVDGSDSSSSSSSNNNQDQAIKYAIVNIITLLSNAMVESIQYDTCEELNGMPSGFDIDKMAGGSSSTNGDEGSSNGNSNSNSNEWNGDTSELNAINGRYFPMSNACGQFGMLYQQDGTNLEQCTDGGDDNNIIDMSCPANPNLSMTAAHHPKYNYQESTASSSSATTATNQSPPPFYCGKKQNENDYSGYWDGYNVEFIHKVAYPSTMGRIDTQGCCFWGRGMLMTKTTCGLGRINYYMGKRAYNDNRPSRYPNINFCTFPSIICGVTNAQWNGGVYPELRYVVALFNWIDRIESYNSKDWNYLDALKSYVDGGMKVDDGNKFIDTVSSVLTRGCDGYYCSMRPIYFLEERKRNFNILIHDIFNLDGNFAIPPQPEPKYDFDHAMRWLHTKRSLIEGNIFVSKNKALDGVAYPSSQYKYEPFLSALRTTAHFGVGEQRFFFITDEKDGVQDTLEGSLRGLNAGLINLAFFLASSMAESITNDICDEIHWDAQVGGYQYSIANSCGQNGRDYGLEICPPWQSFMTCAVNTIADISADASLMSLPPFMLETQPPPFHCSPGMEPAGYWNDNTKRVNTNDPTFSNAYGRTDIQGCCSWGRGVLLTRGSCNYGKINFHLGAQAAADDRPAIYPDIDFCAEPDAICNGNDSMEMRWVVGMFEWIDRVQDYYDSTDDWSYTDELYKFLDGRMDDDVFIDAVSNIAARGCHKPINSECSSSVTSVDTNRFLYGPERRIHFKNIIRLVFELPITETTDNNENNLNPPASSTQPQTSFKRPTFKPTLPPMFHPSPYPMESMENTEAPVTGGDLITPRPTISDRPTRAPFELSDITIYNDGSWIVINPATSFVDESIVITKNTTLIIEEGGYIVAPLNTDWPAIRVSIASVLIGKGGSVNGSYADTSFLEGDYEDGGEGIHMNNGQSNPETASQAEFYQGIKVFGGDAPGGVGGDALHVNGFGTKCYINGGAFTGGAGIRGNGLSLYVLNSATAHIRAGSFKGEMKVERSGIIAFYGCFKRDGNRITGIFEDETELDVTVRSYYGGEVRLIPLAEQECETAPSTSPTNFPTNSPQPTVLRPINGDRHRKVGYGFAIMAAFAMMVSIMLL